MTPATALQTLVKPLQAPCGQHLALRVMVQACLPGKLLVGDARRQPLALSDQMTAELVDAKTTTSPRHPLQACTQSVPLIARPHHGPEAPDRFRKPRGRSQALEWDSGPGLELLGGIVVLSHCYRHLCTTCSYPNPRPRPSPGCSSRFGTPHRAESRTNPPRPRTSCLSLQG
jgi:hypothetical protein